MTKSIDRVPEYLIPLSAEEEKRARKIAGETVFISLHDHPVLFPADMQEVLDYAHEGRQHTAYAALAESYYDCIFVSFMEHFKYIVDLVGIDHVAFGPDTLYRDHVGLHHALLGTLSLKDILGTQSFEEVDHVQALENPTETS